MWCKTIAISRAPEVISMANGWKIVLNNTFTGIANTVTTNNTATTNYGFGFSLQQRPQNKMENYK
ncbi:MAG: hypothetical protein H7296_06340 [Bacteroidia bacterium]|nr:hypothetical protein [Bacteroidia bacterium]